MTQFGGITFPNTYTREYVYQQLLKLNKQFQHESPVCFFLLNYRFFTHQINVDEEKKTICVRCDRCNLLFENELKFNLRCIDEVMKVRALFGLRVLWGCCFPKQFTIVRWRFGYFQLKYRYNFRAMKINKFSSFM